jgi:hypothetical protein
MFSNTEQHFSLSSVTNASDKVRVYLCKQTFTLLLLGVYITVHWTEVDLLKHVQSIVFLILLALDCS